MRCGRATPEIVRQVVEANMERCNWARSVGGMAAQEVFEHQLDTTGYRLDPCTSYWIPENVVRLDDRRI